MEILDPALPEAAIQAPEAPIDQHLEFRGSAAEYFRIWIVNLALTLVTLGIYSAWAKVRRLKYLHGQTFLAGSAFGYHGQPLQILKGRAIATVLLVLYLVAGKVHPFAGLAAGLLLAIAMPWLLVKALKFKMRVTSWRGIRFDFRQDFGAAYRTYWGWGLLALLTLGVMYPQFVRKKHQFALGNMSYGSTAFSCDPPLGALYRTLLLAAGIGIVLFGALIGGFEWFAPNGNDAPWFVALFFVLFLVPYVVIFAVYQAGVLNTVYGHTTLGPHLFHSSLGARRLTGLYLTNLLAVGLSLGLLIPWATIRLLRYRLDTLRVTTHGSLDAFVAAQPVSQPSAAGEEISDFFDVDFGL